MIRHIILWVASTLVAVCAGGEPLDYSYTVIDRQPHDSQRFTQGFAVDGDWFYESSGHYGRSFLVRYHRDTPDQAERTDLPDDVFAEGLAVVGERLYLLSWKGQLARVYSKASLRQLKSIPYRGEGWGLTHDGEYFILSDGSDTLKFLAPRDFSVVRTVRAHSGETYYAALNELEYAQGLIWANRWKTNEIIGINPADGTVVARVDVSALQRESAVSQGESVPNGIAYDTRRDGFWVTGKYWRDRFLLQLHQP